MDYILCFQAILKSCLGGDVKKIATNKNGLHEYYYKTKNWSQQTWNKPKTLPRLNHAKENLENLLGLNINLT